MYQEYGTLSAVITSYKTETKIRSFRDLSAKTKKGVKSLNECLHRGPVMLERFRTKKIGIIADIENAFLQIGPYENDQDDTGFLWPKGIYKPITNDNLEIYRFTRLPFGVI